MAKKAATKKKKSKKTKYHCNECPSICCTNLALSILKPNTKAEIEDLKWLLRFDTVKVYIRHNRWHEWVQGRCMYLDEHNLCTIYDHRPSKCRNHNPPNCEKFGDFYDVIFNTPDELEDYLKQKKRNKR